MPPMCFADIKYEINIVIQLQHVIHEPYAKHGLGSGGLLAIKQVLEFQ